MIYSELFGKHLRLGNFLFEFASNLKLSLVHNTQASYPDWYYLWKYLENPPITHSVEPNYGEIIRPWKWGWTQEEEDYINGLDYTKDVTFALNHFRQSYKWFEGYGREVIKSLRPKSEVVSYLFGKHKECFMNKPTIGLGIRLGDFVGHGDFFQIPPEWYIKVLNQEFPNWKTDYQVVVFSDDILKAKQLFKDYPFYYTDFNDTASHREQFKFYHGDASEQFFLGTLMDNFICGNSTFTWWQSYLATHNRETKWTKEGKGGKVVHSGEVFRGKAKQERDITNYYHKDWIQVNI